MFYIKFLCNLRGFACAQKFIKRWRIIQLNVYTDGMPCIQNQGLKKNYTQNCFKKGLRVISHLKPRKGNYVTGILPIAAGFRTIPSYYCYRCAFGKNYPGCDLECAHYLAKVIELEGAQTVAAFIGEPLQGVGGMIAPPPEYWPIIRKI